MQHVMRPFRLLAILILMVTSFVPIHSLSVQAADNTWTVINTNSTGTGSLRWAIEQANSSAGSDRIVFNIPTSDPRYQSNGAYWSIDTTTRLPALTGGNITIDGTVPAGGTVPKIEIAGGSTGLFIKSSNNTVRGLIINTLSSFLVVDGPRGVGVVISALDGAADNNIVEYCYLGTNHNGTQALPNNTGGLAIVYGANNNTVRNNVISGNDGYGAYVGQGPNTTDAEANSGNRLENNIIGLNAAGTAALPNKKHGVEIFDNAINTTIGPGNVISGNGRGVITDPHFGISIIGRLVSNGTPISDNSVVGNLIGTNRDGTSSIPNAIGGIRVGTSKGTTIGDAGDTNRNIISGHSTGTGVLVDDQELGVSGARDGIQITNNWIGLNRNGTGVLGNKMGVIVQCGATAVTVGPNNVISGHTDDGGIRIRNATNVSSDTRTGPDCNKATERNKIIGNRIGTNPAGDQPGSNNPFLNRFGIIIEENASNNTIGGTGANDGNLISGNEFFGIGIGKFGGGDSANDNVIQGNRVEFNGRTDNNNNADGILIRSDTRNNRITQTTTTGNAGAGIGLSNGNNDLAAPTISSVNVTGTVPNLTLSGNISGGASCGGNSCIVEVFDSAVSENQEGPGYLTSFTTSGSGTFSVPLSACRPYLTFTVTDQNNNTSPFTNAFGPFAQCNATTPTFGVSFAPPNLSRGPIAPGESADYTYTLENTGSQQDTYDLAGTSATPGVTFDFEPASPITLAAGTQRNVRVTVNIPGNATGTSVSSSVTATSRGDTSKRATVNQTTILEEIPQEPQPELTATGSTSQDGNPGATVTYNYRLENVGNAAGSFALSVTGLPSGWSGTLTPNGPVALNPDATANIELRVTIPAGAAAGVQGVAMLRATAEGNSDTETATTTVLLVPGLTFTPVPPQDRSTASGQTVNYQYRLTNTGNGQDEFTIDVSPPAGWNVSVQPGTTITLERNQSQVVTVRLTVPAGTNPGDYPMEVTATSNADSAVTELVRSTTTIVDAPVPLLSLEPAQSTDPGIAVTFTHTITNVGTQPGTFDLSILTPPAGWTVLPSTNSVTLTVGQQTTFDVTATPPASALADDYTFTVQARATGPDGVAASAVDTVTINQIADLLLTAPDPTTEPPDTVVTYTFTLENNGNFTDTISLDAGSSEGWSVSTVPSETVQIAPGASRPIDVVVTIPLGQVAGLEATTTLTATSSIVSEQETAQVVTTIDAVPGVKLTPGVAEGDGLPAEPITVTFTLINSGSIDQSYALTLTDVPQTPPGWIASVTPETTPSLTPSEAISVEVVLQSPEEIEKGTFDIILEALSSPDAITTTATARITIGALLDIELTPTEVSGRGWYEPVDYDFTITNTGRISETFVIDPVSLLGWNTMGTTEILLEPTQSASIGVSVIVPYGANAGAVDTTILTVSSQTDPEVQAQATITTTVSQASGVDFSPSDVRPPDPGAEIRFQHTIVNIGNGSDNFVITATQDLNWPITIDTVTTPRVRRGATFPVEVRVRIPGDVSDLAFNRIVVRASAQNDPTVYDEVLDLISPVQRLEPPSQLYLPLVRR